MKVLAGMAMIAFIALALVFAVQENRAWRRDHSAKAQSCFSQYESLGRLDALSSFRRDDYERVKRKLDLDCAEL